ncbi:MAG: AfsR/SARP family transcriptional regulator, partial [Natronosporangium sp.]
MSEAPDRPGKLAVGLLGPLELMVAGRAVPLATGRLPTLLAVLAMAAGGPVPVDRLAAALWGGEAQPGIARRSVQTYLARLRAILPAGSIDTTPVGYLLRVDPDDVDALRLLRQLDAAAGAPDRDTERARLAGALALWRGSPFEGLDSDWLARTEAPRLLERYLSGLERRVDLDLQAGRHRELVPELRQLTGRHPLRESLWVRLLAALDRGERHAEALAEYQAVRARLADELGVDPGPQLRRAHADLLA